MAAKSTNTPATSKARSRRNPNLEAPNLIGSIIYIHPEIRKEIESDRWQNKFLQFVCAFKIENEDHRTACPVIPFPVVNKRSAAKEA